MKIRTFRNRSFPYYQWNSALERAERVWIKERERRRERQPRFTIRLKSDFTINNLETKCFRLVFIDREKFRLYSVIGLSSNQLEISTPIPGTIERGIADGTKRLLDILLFESPSPSNTLWIITVHRASAIYVSRENHLYKASVVWIVGYRCCLLHEISEAGKWNRHDSPCRSLRSGIVDTQDFPRFRESWL